MNKNIDTGVMKLRAIWLIVILIVVCLASPVQSQTAANYTVVISLDGCRWDYPEWYDTPFFDYMAQEGVESGLIPSFPSKTFPNHYTLATGLYPDHHGIIANTFYDIETGERFSLSNPKTKYNEKYYGGEPIWLTAQHQGVHTAVFYWPGSDVKVKGEYPEVFHKYDSLRLTHEERVEGIIRMLSLPEPQRPRLIMAYFEQPDHNGHRYGPQSKHTRRAVEQMDSLMQRLYTRIKQTSVGDSVNFIVLSDHGMTTLSEQRIIDIASLLPSHWTRAIASGTPTNIYAEQAFVDSIYNTLQHVDHIRVWKKHEIPAYLHYGSHQRVGDVVVVPDLGWVVGDFEEYGTHGFDPFFNDMHAIFRAVGPDFKHVSLPHFSNVNVYSIVCHLLRIQPSHNDGNIGDIRAMFNDNGKKD